MMRLISLVLCLTALCSLPTVLHGFQLPQQLQSPSQLTTPRSRLQIPSSLRNQQLQCPRPLSPLFSSPDDGLTPNNNRGKRLILAVRRALTRVSSFPIRFATAFSKLSRRAKTIVVMQMLILTMLIGSFGKTVYTKMQTGGTPAAPVELAYSNFLDLVEQSGSAKKDAVKIDNVRIGPDRIIYRLTRETASDEEKARQMVAYTRQVSASPDLIKHLRSNEIPFAAAPQARPNTIAVVARTAILGFYMLILIRMYKSFSGNSGAGDIPGKLAGPSSGPLASFTDIQGIDDAKLEVMELVDALKYPAKYAILGARAPTGLLLEGPPGTGKTMLARATAATAGVPLLYCSGSDFVEMYVGRGAARVRKMFERASKIAPCIIFVDELDALGKARDSGNSFMNSRGNDEAEQTLNQLLACMDGLDSTRRICVLGATNRKEVLDPALIRPGRFDRIVTLKLPDSKGRENILRVHASKLPGFQEVIGVDSGRVGSLGKGDKIDLSAVAAVTGGLSGAELEFVVNEAAIRAVRRVSSAIKDGNTLVNTHVRPQDFEASLQNFYATRRPKDGIFKNPFTL